MAANIDTHVGAFLVLSRPLILALWKQKLWWGWMTTVRLLIAAIHFARSLKIVREWIGWSTTIKSKAQNRRRYINLRVIVTHLEIAIETFVYLEKAGEYIDWNLIVTPKIKKKNKIYTLKKKTHVSVLTNLEIAIGIFVYLEKARECIGWKVIVTSKNRKKQ